MKARNFVANAVAVGAGLTLAEAWKKHPGETENTPKRFATLAGFLFLASLLIRDDLLSPKAK